ncbi:hypothetical protein BC628DRAFT_1337966 [Trametes gibbosa]|nr:hypothetical protein BC628DRAFT_608987 [Trametes gibbosa]KAI0828356.1 hypothetical protein BC628DRAFT_1337966 [Trametes gibbosa]
MPANVRSPRLLRAAPGAGWAPPLPPLPSGMQRRRFEAHTACLSLVARFTPQIFKKVSMQLPPRRSISDTPTPTAARPGEMTSFQREGGQGAAGRARLILLEIGGGGRVDAPRASAHAVGPPPRSRTRDAVVIGQDGGWLNVLQVASGNAEFIIHMSSVAWRFRLIVDARSSSGHALGRRQGTPNGRRPEP